MPVRDFAEPPTAEDVHARLAELVVETPGASGAELLERLAGELWVSGYTAGQAELAGAQAMVFMGPTRIEPECIPGVCRLPKGHGGGHPWEVDPAALLAQECSPGRCVLPKGHLGRHVGPNDRLVVPLDPPRATCRARELGMERICILPEGHSGDHKDLDSTMWRARNA